MWKTELAANTTLTLHEWCKLHDDHKLYEPDGLGSTRTPFLSVTFIPYTFHFVHRLLSIFLSEMLGLLH